MPLQFLHRHQAALQQVAREHIVTDDSHEHRGEPGYGNADAFIQSICKADVGTKEMQGWAAPVGVRNWEAGLHGEAAGKLILRRKLRTGPGCLQRKKHCHHDVFSLLLHVAKEGKSCRLKPGLRYGLAISIHGCQGHYPGAHKGRPYGCKVVCGTQ